MKKVNSVLELIGETPIVRLNKLGDKNWAQVWVKLEFFNPGGSVKDRIALNMIEEAEKAGKLNKDSVIVEPTSGNTGIGLAVVAAARGYRLILVMPETMSIERRSLMQIFGAEFVLTPGQLGMKGAVDKAQELAAKNANYFIPQQFANPANPAIHRQTTAREILAQMSSLDAFVAGIGTGGTITGVGEALKEADSGIQIIAVEPEASPVLSGGEPGPHKIQGLGAGFVPEVLNTQIYDEIIKVKNEDAIATAQSMAREEGILVGISAGAAVWAALKVAKNLGAGKQVLALAPDTGER